MSDRTTALSGIIELIFNDLPKCPEPVMMQQVLRALTILCEEAKIWQMDLDEMFVGEAITDYDLDGWDPAIAQIDTVLGVKLNGLALTPVKDFILAERTILRLNDDPSSDLNSGLEVTVSLKPSTTATATDKDLFDGYRWSIAEGAKYLCMAMPMKPWTNVQAAVHVFARWRAAISQARAGINKGNLPGTRLSIAGRRFAI